MKKTFYVDTCVYLNLWQTEGDEKRGVPYWKLAKNFFEKYNNSIIYYSGFLLKELKFILTKEEFENKSILFLSSPNFRRLKISADEFYQARKIEDESNFNISFYDIIHLLLAKKSNSILITRDNKLLSIAQKYGIQANKPEDLL